MIRKVIDFWFLPTNYERHFNKTVENDMYITSHFKDYLQLNYHLALNARDKFAFIILYDQLVRHFYRNDQDKIDYYHKIALELSEELLVKKYDLCIQPIERCFLLMPLRHTFDITYLDRVLLKIVEYRSKKMCAEYDRFYKATILSYSKLKIDKLDIEPIDELISDNDIYDLLDKKSHKNISKICDLPYHNKLYKIFNKNIRSGVLLSLSGGVDSMVCSFLLHKLSTHMKINVKAVMINYGNRDRCNIEVEFVKRWCKLLNIELYVYHMNELKRNRNEDRDLYEKLTNKVRFSLYQHFDCSVILGHNRDDCEENILTNILKKQKWDNLYGMTVDSIINDVRILRPLLDIKKNEIYKFADEFQIPYLYDSTPDWSVRGQLRRNVIPELERVNMGFPDSLCVLATHMSELYVIQERYISDFYSKNVSFNDDKTVVTIKFDKNREETLLFWQTILQKIIDKPISYQSIVNFYKQLYIGGDKKIILNKYLYAKIYGNEISIYFN